MLICIIVMYTMTDCQMHLFSMLVSSIQAFEPALWIFAVFLHLTSIFSTASEQTCVKFTLSWQSADSMHMCGCRDKAKQCISTRRFVCRRIFGLFSLCSLSVFRQLLAAVRARIDILHMKLVITLPHMNLDPHTVTLSLTSLNS